jgi:hypothetical protein
MKGVYCGADWYDNKIIIPTNIRLVMKNQLETPAYWVSS